MLSSITLQLTAIHNTLFRHQTVVVDRIRSLFVIVVAEEAEAAPEDEEEDVLVVVVVFGFRAGR